MPDSTALSRFSNISQRDVYFDKHVVRRTNWSRGRTHIFREICQNQVQKRSSTSAWDPVRVIDRLSQSQWVAESFCWNFCREGAAQILRFLLEQVVYPRYWIHPRVGCHLAPVINLRTCSLLWQQSHKLLVTIHDLALIPDSPNQMYVWWDVAEITYLRLSCLVCDWPDYMNCPQAGRFSTKCSLPQMDVKLDVPSASISCLTWKIPR